MAQAPGIEAILAEVGPRLKRVRERRDITLAELSETTGISKSTLDKRDITLGPGEVAEFDTRVPHWFGPAGDEPVEVLSLLGRRGHRMHVRAEGRRKTGDH